MLTPPEMEQQQTCWLTIEFRMKLMPRVPLSTMRLRAPVCLDRWKRRSSACRCANTWLATSRMVPCTTCSSQRCSVELTALWRVFKGAWARWCPAAARWDLEYPLPEWCPGGERCLVSLHALLSRLSAPLASQGAPFAAAAGICVHCAAGSPAAAGHTLSHFHRPCPAPGVLCCTASLAAELHGC